MVAFEFQLRMTLLTVKQVRVLCEKAKEILMEEDNVQVCVDIIAKLHIQCVETSHTVYTLS